MKRLTSEDGYVSQGDKSKNLGKLDKAALETEERSTCRSTASIMQEANRRHIWVNQ